MWYTTWGAMACIAFVNTVARVGVLSGGRGLILSAALIALTVLQITRGYSFLSEREKTLVPIALVLFGFAQTTQTLRNPGPSRAIDFAAYYVAGKLMAETPARSPYLIPFYADGRMQFIVPALPESAWQAAASEFHVTTSMPFIYPPLVAVMLRPLSHLSFEAGYLVWKGLSVILLLAGIGFALSVSGIALTRTMVVVIAVGVFSYSPVSYDILLGQTGAVLLFLVSGSVWLMVRGRTAVSALGFGLATLIKLTPVMAVPVLVMHRRWKWLGWYAVWLAVLMGYSVWQGGWGIQQQFWREVLPSISCGASVCQNNSGVAWVQELFLGRVPETMDKPILLPAMACAVSRLVAFGIFCLALVRLYKRRIDREPVRDIVAMVLVSLAVSPISWWHHYTVALLPFFYLWGRSRDGQNGLLALITLAVGTNLVVLALWLTGQHALQLMLAGVVPLLTIAVALRALRCPAINNASELATQTA